MKRSGKQCLLFIVTLVPVSWSFGAEKERVMEEIIVTAEKRGEQSAQELAASITAFNAKALERLDVLDFDDFIVQVPGTNFLNNGGPGRGNELASIRGLSPVADNTGGVVAQYLDGAPRFGRNYRLFDIGEVSVLRGPQGTLWGAQSIGGLISFRSNRPDSTRLDGMVQADSYTTSNDGGMSYRLSGHLNIPVVKDVFALRFAGHVIDESGYVDNAITGKNDINDVKENAWRISAMFTPNDSTSVTLIYHGNDLEADASTFFNPDMGDLESSDILDFLPADQEYDLVNLILDISFERVALDYTISWFNLDNVYQDVEENVFDIPSFYGLTTNTLNERSWTHEFRLSSKGEQPLQWLVGLYFDDLEGSDFSQQLEILNPNDSADQPFAFEGFEIFALGGPEDFKETALFGEVSYDFNEQWQLLLGGRFFDWEVDNREQFTFFGGNFQQETGVVGDNDFFWKTRLSWRPDDDLLFYLSRAEGFRFGGFNPFVGPALNIPEQFIRFDPDTLVNYELGFKSVLVDGRVIFNGSIYYMDWKDIQTVVRNESEDFAFTTNAPSLEAKGFELELKSQDLLVEGFYGALTYAYTTNEFKEDAIVFMPVNREPLIQAGEKLRRTPKNTWSVDIGYEFKPANNVTGFVRANYWHKDNTTTEGFNGNDGIVPIPDQDVVNASAGAIFNSWMLKLYIDNLTDERPYLQVFPVNATGAPGADLAARVSSIRPRTIGLELTYQFGDRK